MNQTIFEYDFIKYKNVVYRVFGQYHPKDRIQLLIRYTLIDNEWKKTAKFGGELNKPESINLYNIDKLYYPEYKTSLGLLDVSKNYEVYSSLECFNKKKYVHSKTIIYELNEYLESTGLDFKLGLSGSSLLDINNKSSDVDLIVYSEHYKLIANNIMIFMSKKNATLPSSSKIDQFLNLSGISFKDFKKRNSFSFQIEDKKIDIHYCFNSNPIMYHTKRNYSIIKNDVQLTCQIIDSSNRFYYPGMLDIMTADINHNNNNEYKLILMDHPMHFLSDGDIIDLNADILYDNINSITVLTSNYISKIKARY